MQRSRDGVPIFNLIRWCPNLDFTGAVTNPRVPDANLEMCGQDFVTVTTKSHMLSRCARQTAWRAGLPRIFRRGTVTAGENRTVPLIARI